MTSGVLRALLVLVTGALLTLGVAAPAGAHAVLLGTDPVDGQVLATAPDAVTLMFNEPVRVESRQVEVLASDSSALDTQARSVDSTVVITLPSGIADGTYVVSWRVTSADGHPITGAFTFSVGAPSTTSAVVDGGGDAAVEWARRVVQALVYLGLLASAGLVLFRALVLRQQGPADVDRRLRRLGVAATGVALLGLALTVPLAAVVQDGLALSALTQIGAAAWTSLAAGAAALGAVAILAATALGHRETGPVLRGVAVGAAVTALASLLLTGHTRTFGPTALVWAADLLHLVAGATWFAGVIGLTVLLGGRSGGSPDTAARVVGRFSTLAADLLITVAVTGVLLGWRILGSVDALLSTGYGRVLLVKVALVACVALVAAYNRYRLLPRLLSAPAATVLLRRTVAVEAALIAVLLVVTGVLVSLNPAAPTAQRETTSATETVAGVTLSARIDPAERGANTVALTLTGSSGAPLEPVSVPEVRVTGGGIGPLTAPVTRLGPGQFTAAVDLPLPGTWQVAIAARVSTYNNVTATLMVVVP